MNLKNLAIGSLLATSLVFVGCGDDDTPAVDAGGGGTDVPEVDTGPGDDAGPVVTPLPGTCADGSCFFVVDMLAVPGPDDTGAVIGANLDDEITTPGDPTGCGKTDYNHPDGTMGIDNALVQILSIIEPMLDEPISDQLTAQIAEGSLLITIKLEGADSMNDLDVTGTLYPNGMIPGDAAPMLNADGSLAADQTIDIDSAPITINGSITDGRFVASLDNFPIMLPLEEAPLVLNVSQALFSADITENGLENGEISGSLSIDELATAVGEAMLGDIDEETARGLLQSVGDLEPNVEGTICARISLGLGFNGIPAVEGETL